MLPRLSQIEETLTGHSLNSQATALKQGTTWKYKKKLLFFELSKQASSVTAFVECVDGNKCNMYSTNCSAIVALKTVVTAMMYHKNTNRSINSMEGCW